ncbi:hypothetical protein WJ54_11460 [Burkholderia ubonensis]|nr:hypothetical protein WJ54_11460 [Burkholderia ubonensis]
MNTKWCQFLIQSLGQPFHSELRRRVDAKASRTAIATDRRNIQDVPSALCAHVRQDCSRDVEQAKNIGAVEPFDLVRSRFLDGAQQAETSIVQQHVDPSEALDGLCRCCRSLDFVSDVKG